MHRYALARRSVDQDQGLSAGPRGPCRRHGGGQSPVRRCRHLSLPNRHSMARSARALRRLESDAQSATGDGAKVAFLRGFSRLWRSMPTRVHVDRLDQRARASAQRRRPKKDGEDQAIGRSRGGLTTKIHAIVDALGNPVALSLTPGQAPTSHRRCRCSTRSSPKRSLADKGYDSDALVETLEERGITPVIPPKANRKAAAQNRLRPLSRAQPRRAVLQQAQAIPRDRHPLRQARQHVSLPASLLVCVLLAQLTTGPSPFA